MYNIYIHMYIHMASGSSRAREINVRRSVCEWLNSTCISSRAAECIHRLYRRTRVCIMYNICTHVCTYVHITRVTHARICSAPVSDASSRVPCQNQYLASLGYDNAALCRVCVYVYACIYMRERVYHRALPDFAEFARRPCNGRCKQCKTFPISHAGIFIKHFWIAKKRSCRRCPVAGARKCLLTSVIDAFGTFWISRLFLSQSRDRQF